MLSYLAEKSSVSAKFRCDLGQKLHSVTKDWLLIFLFLHSLSVCDNDNFILMLAPQGHMIVAGRNQAIYCLLQATKKREICCSRKNHEVWFYWTALGDVPTSNQLGGHDLSQSTYPIALVRNEVGLIQNTWIYRKE